MHVMQTGMMNGMMPPAMAEMQTGMMNGGAPSDAGWYGYGCKSESGHAHF